MFSYLRYFAAISFVLVAIVAGAVGVYFKSIASQDLEDLVRRNNVVLAQGYINTVWKKHHTTLVRLSRIDVKSWDRYREFREFRNETLDYFEEMPVTDVNIYNLKGELILSSEPGKENAMFTSEAEQRAFALAADGTANGRIIEERPFYNRDGSADIGTMVQTFLPIMSDYYVPVVTDNKMPPSEAIIELSYNITTQWSRLWSFQLVTTGGILLIFATLIGVLFLSSRKAEAIIARQHELNLELTAAAASAEAENRDKSQFLANISHELRTPLNAIIGFSEILRNEALESMKEQHKEYIRDIHGSGVHLLSLINDILDFSKAEAGKLEVSITEIDGVKMIKNCMRLMIPRAEQTQVTLVEDLPKKHFTLQSDAKKLKQVLLNILSNAVKFTPAGGEVKVSAHHNLAEDTLVIEVSDTGIGIAPKDISRVMTPFGQVDSTLARKYEGTGLGLPLSKKFVEILGGEFSIKSEVNIGTVVTLSFPRIYSA